MSDHIEAIRLRAAERERREAERRQSEHQAADLRNRQRAIREAAGELVELCRGEVTSESLCPILEQLVASVHDIPEVADRWRDAAVRIATAGHPVDDIAAADASSLLSAALEDFASIEPTAGEQSPLVGAMRATRAAAIEMERCHPDALPAAARVAAVAVAALAGIDTIHNRKLDELAGGCHEKNLVVDAVVNSRGLVPGMAGPTQHPTAEPTGTQRESQPGEKPRITREEAEVRVREWLIQHKEEAEGHSGGITRNRIADETGVSQGMVSGCSAWVAFRDARDARRVGEVRTVQMTSRVEAVLPADLGPPDELAELIEEQRADDESGGRRTRRHNRRHGPS